MRDWLSVLSEYAAEQFGLSLLAILQFFSRPGLIFWFIQPRWGGNAFGSYVNYNHCAGLMEMLIPISGAFLLSRPQHQPWRGLMGFALAISITSLVLSGSRGGIISLQIESLLLSVVAGFRWRRFGKRSAGAVVSLALVQAIGLSLWIIPRGTFARFQNLVQSPSLSFADKQQML